MRLDGPGRRRPFLLKILLFWSGLRGEESLDRGDVQIIATDDDGDIGEERTIRLNKNTY